MPGQEFNKFSSFQMTEAELKFAVESISPETQMWLQNLFSQSKWNMTLLRRISFCKKKHIRKDRLIC